MIHIEVDISPPRSAPYGNTTTSATITMPTWNKNTLECTHQQLIWLYSRSAHLLASERYVCFVLDGCTTPTACESFVRRYTYGCRQWWTDVVILPYRADVHSKSTYTFRQGSWILMIIYGGITFRPTIVFLTDGSPFQHRWSGNWIFSQFFGKYLSDGIDSRFVTSSFCLVSPFSPRKRTPQPLWILRFSYACKEASKLTYEFLVLDIFEYGHTVAD